MEVDYPSGPPSRRFQSHPGQKRGRSPSSPTAFIDRPQKRMLLGTDCTLSSLPSTPTRPSMKDGQVPKVLRFSNSNHYHACSMSHEMRKQAIEDDIDTIMTIENRMDYRTSPPALPVPSRPSTMTPGLLSLEYSLPPPASPPMQDISPPFPTSYQHSHYPSISTSHHSLSVASSQIHIHLQPPTPHSGFAPLEPSSETFVPQYSQPMQQTSPRKMSRTPSMTMGPRADCEKCRLKVAGHWMHYD